MYVCIRIKKSCRLKTIYRKELNNSGLLKDMKEKLQDIIIYTYTYYFKTNNYVVLHFVKILIYITKSK